MENQNGKANNGKTPEKPEDVKFEALLAEKQVKIEEYINDLKRLQAEFENYKKRMEREQQEYFKYVHAELLQELLGIMDSLEAGLQAQHQHNIKFEANLADVKNSGFSHKNMEKNRELDGLKTLHKQLANFLHKHGVKAISCKGKPLDAHTQEVIAYEHVPEKPDGIVLEEIQKGYQLHDKVLRYAKVKVNKLKTMEGENKGER